MPERLYRLSGLERDSGEHIANVTRSDLAELVERRTRREEEYWIIAGPFKTNVLLADLSDPDKLSNTQGT